MFKGHMEGKDGMKIYKKALSILLALAMMLAMLPMAVVASNGKVYISISFDGEFIENKANTRYKVIDIPVSEINGDLLDELSELKESGNYKVKARISCDTTEASSIDKQKLIEAGATKVEIITERIEIASVESHSLDQKFDKDGIKKEYVGFCNGKEISSEMGLQYLDKINSYFLNH